MNPLEQPTVMKIERADVQKALTDTTGQFAVLETTSPSITGSLLATRRRPISAIHGSCSPSTIEYRNSSADKA
jgi:hypothetical protein